MSIENLLALFMSCMVIATTESAFNNLVTFVAFHIKHANDAVNTATAYCAAAKKDVGESAPIHRVQCAARMEMIRYYMKGLLKH
jgi:hypothetical protein